MTHTVFIDGQYGTTGLQLQQRLAVHPEISLLQIDAEQRHDPALRQQYLNQADVVFLCLPDEAARQAVSLVANDQTLIIDASTAHRVASGWEYGLPELPGQRTRLHQSNRISNPGCYPTGMILLTKPLVDARLLPKDYPLSVSAITGYSGGGKQMIADYEQPENRHQPERAARLKNLDLKHKHLPEMQHQVGLDYPPVFVPTVGDFAQGMLVQVPLHQRLLAASAENIHECLASAYASESFVQLMPLNDTSLWQDGFLNPTACNHSNRCELFVYSHQGLILLVARLDNLGKGASGAAIQNMNLRLGLPETTGLS